MAPIIPSPPVMSMTPISWMICGTVPDKDFPLIEGCWRLEHDFLRLENGDLPPLSVQRGTPALMASAVLTCQTLDAPPPSALLVGDTGNGDGSRALYARLTTTLRETAPAGLTFHYLFPDLDGHNRVLMALEELRPKPVLVADAGFMYVAKMSGYADAYDLFTPDAGELAFLADEKAPHPFYTRGFLLSADKDVPLLVQRAYAHNNAAHFLLIKGKTDYLVHEGQFLGQIADPQVPTLEPIGGTGDLVTGIVTGLLASGMDMVQACLTAARASRITGQLAQPTPATQIAELLPFLPQALRHAMQTAPCGADAP